MRSFDYSVIAKKEGHSVAQGMLHVFLNKKRIDSNQLDCNTGLPRWNGKRLSKIGYKYITFSDGSRIKIA